MESAARIVERPSIPVRPARSGQVKIILSAMICFVHIKTRDITTRKTGFGVLETKNRCFHARVRTKGMIFLP
jgi:hypothetical protein